MSHVKTDKLSARTASGTVELGVSGETISIPSGVTISNSGTASGFSEAAYAANASASTGAVNVDASDNLQFDSGYGSTVTAYGCRAWVNFNGTGTVSIFDSGNVSSITDSGTGTYSVNFTVAMPDVNYAVAGSVVGSTVTGYHSSVVSTGVVGTTNYCNIKTVHPSNTTYDLNKVSVIVIR